MTVYALGENAYIRQVMGLYGRDHPDTLVRLQVGLTEGDSILAADAIRILTTELLAGKGPDVLVLDDLPMESYRRHGVLLELGQPLAAQLGDLIPGAVDAFRQDDSIYILPARGSMPVLAGMDVEDVHDFADLVGYVEGQALQRTGITGETVIPVFYPMCASRWFRQDGTVEESVMAADLAQLVRLVELSEAVPYNEELSGSGLDPQATCWSGGILTMITGTLGQMESMASIYSAMDVRGGGTIKPFPDEGGGLLIPSCLLGVNAAGGQTDAAVNFVRQALSEEAQVYRVYESFGVNRKALEAVAATKEPGAEHGISGVRDDGSGLTAKLESFWPTLERMDSIIQLIAGAQPGPYLDESIREMVLEETAPLFAGDRSVEETVQALSQKIQRMLDEMG